jgi:hypothetical protein
VDKYTENIREDDLDYDVLMSAIWFLRTYYPNADDEALLRELILSAG